MVTMVTILTTCQRLRINVVVVKDKNNADSRKLEALLNITECTY